MVLLHWCRGACVEVVPQEVQETAVWSISEGGGTVSGLCPAISA